MSITAEKKLVSIDEFLAMPEVRAFELIDETLRNGRTWGLDQLTSQCGLVRP